MRLDRYMELALAHPEYGYYMTRDPFGSAGDFTTAPEISQLFGEIIGIWCAQQWMTMGVPEQCNLIEIGPGRGTLMADLLRGTKHIPNFHDSLNIHLIETSPVLIKKQQETLREYSVSWHQDLSSIANDIPSIIIANEFFDALPIRQFTFNNGKWSEHYIDIESGNLKTTWLASDYIPQNIPKAKNGDIFETSPVQEEYANLVCKHITKKGEALIIDYGHTATGFGDTLQALYKHEPCSFLSHVGDADITTHIDFERLSYIFKDYRTRISTQAEFLHKNGISLRLQSLLERNKDPKIIHNLQSGYDRLTSQDQMGNLFKVLEISTSSNP